MGSLLVKNKRLNTGAPFFSLAFLGKYGVALVFLCIYFAVNLIVRIGLIFYNQDPTILSATNIGLMLSIGFLYDFAVATWWLLPLAILAFFWPSSPRANKFFAAANYFLLIFMFGFLSFISICEFIFWNEFSSRFNFIAVDYLVYTREVIGNLKASFPIPLLWALLISITIIMLLLTAKPVWSVSQSPFMPWRKRSALFSLFIALPFLAYFGVPADLKDKLNQPQAVQLAGNGSWEFFHAFHQNSIDYQQFYATLPKSEMTDFLHEEYSQTRAAHITGSNDFPIERDVSSAKISAEKKLNVVLISVESLGSEFVGTLGGAKGLVPNIERLGQEGLWFSHVYATGSRTVRGLEALTLSIPPTPGHAIPMRPHHTGLATLGGVFKALDYEPIYIYGGYSYFDNMKAFFSDNGYTVIDRAAIAANEITHETIWGVADEDLFKLTIKELDARFKAKKSFFAHVMTTSNHRPYTFPENRVDLPIKTREGAVKYTDYAINRFFEEAKKKPWFDDTVFVVVADHTSVARGKTDLPPENYHIPLFIYSPKHIKPQVISSMMSQIDVGPTLLGLLGVNYRSRFFGRDIFAEGSKDSHIFMANYQTIGFLDGNVLVELKPKSIIKASLLGSLPQEGLQNGAPFEDEIMEAKSFYQFASSVARDFTH